MGIGAEGIDQAAGALDALAADVEHPDAALAQVATTAAQRLASRLPRRSGRLAGSVRGEVVNGAAVVTVGRGPTLAYAGPIVRGWPARGIKPSTAPARTDADLATLGADLLTDHLDTALERHDLT